MKDDTQLKRNKNCWWGKNPLVMLRIKTGCVPYVLRMYEIIVRSMPFDADEYKCNHPECEASRDR